jgi:acetylornithine deacetylase/succinyl-diaminopimelate desuccinylase-like protein
MIAMRRFRSVVTERAGAAEHRVCAEWFVEELRGIGFSASVRDTPGRPIAVGHDRGSPGPSVLFCGHYETQASCLSRGNLCRAIHHSTQLMAFVEACRAWKAVAGQLPAAVSVLVEGEGLSGSASLRSFLHMYADELEADIGFAPAARIWCCAVPAINTMLRGVCCEEFTIAVDSDQLTGPGAAADPTRILVRILSDLHDPSGRVAIPDFYAGIDAPLPPLAGRPSGAPSGSCDLDYAPRSIVPETEREEEAMWVGPTCEIDSVSGSRTAAGRLVTSPSAFAKVSFHLVCDQDPDVVSRAFREFARARVPPGSRIEFASGKSAPPIRFTASSPTFRKVQQALTIEWGREAVFACGDAVPAIHALREALGMEVIVTSFPKRQDGCRTPREASELANYRSGVRSWVRILDALAR